MEIIKNLSLSIVTIRTFPVFILEKYDISIQIKINELQGGETKWETKIDITGLFMKDNFRSV